VFTDPSGRGIIAVFTADGRSFLAAPGSPATAGDVLVIYCTGLGAVNPAVPAGTAAPSSPLSETTNRVTVTLGGRPAQVAFSGLTPGFAGLYQVNAVVPEGVAAGDQVPVVLTVAGQAGRPVTIAVR
jgi:adhesin/invasin